MAGAALGAADGRARRGVVAVLGSGAFGALDDLAGDGSSKGLKGHLGAAARGEVTTGLVKVVGIGLTGLAAAALADRGRDDVARARHPRRAAPSSLPRRTWPTCSTCAPGAR